MSDQQQGPDWWQASDGRWYPAEQHPDHLASASGPSGAEPTAGPAEAPPPVPPAGPPPAGETAGGGGAGKGKVIIGVVVVLALIAGAFVLVTQLSDDEAEASVLLEPIGSSGPAPFSEPAAPEPGGSLLAYAESGPPSGDEDVVSDGERRGRYKAADGSVPGLYGGSLDEEACDVDQLVGFLSVEDDKAAAWAQVLEIDQGDIPRYIERLTAVNLGSDTRVVNHGFADGTATPRESVLQRGSAVLVDERGVPRVSCYCGNPLLPPSLSDDESFDGAQWSTFEPAEVLVVDEAPQDLSAFELRDIESGELFTRQAGSRPATTERTDDGPIEFDVTYPDVLEDDRTEARYTFDAPDSAIMTLSIANAANSNRRVVAELESRGSRFERVVVDPGVTESAEVMLDHEGGAPFELTFTEGPAAFEFEVALELQRDADQDGDAGDIPASAFEVDAGDEIRGRLGGQDTVDMYLIDVVPGSRLQLEFEVDRESPRRAVIEIHLQGDRLYRGVAEPGVSDDFDMLLAGDDAGDLEVTVTEGPATYAFTVAMVEQADGGQPGDAGDALADARSIPIGEELSGQVGDRDPVDWYTFEAPGPETVIRIENPATSARRIVVEIDDESGSRVGREVVNAGSTAELVFEATPGETYRMRVVEGRAEYSFTITG